MGIIFFKTKLSKITTDNNFRCDPKYGNFVELKPEEIWDFDTFCELRSVLKAISSPTIKKGELEEELFLVDLANIERKKNSLKGLVTVSEIGSDKNFIKEGDIVIPKIEPKKGQFFLNLDHNEYLGSTELVEYKINKREFNPYFIYYILTSEKLLTILSFLESGKTHKRVSSENLLKIKIPKISLHIQNIASLKIEKINKEISDLQNSVLKPLDITNKVFSEYFDIEMNLISKLDKTNKISTKLSDVVFYNSNFRNGTRWNKMQFIQNSIYANIDCIKVLGEYIKSTKNGWSPLSIEGGEGTPILGQEHFSFDGILKINPSKNTEESRNNIEDFFVRKGDFFVSRGNTVDLVALACIVNDEIDEDILFPDLYIKIELDEERVNKEYLAYIFNSFFGRLYFKYVAKGKNQTMVKISSSELLNFRFPLPTIKVQEAIVEIIKSQLNEQKIIDKIIDEKQHQINRIIDDAIQKEKNYKQTHKFEAIAKET
ncbi:hypothetical protein ACW9KT_16015 [Hymenobacter sp. HD11105]